MQIISYIHHDTLVFVDEELKGRHRLHCLCWQGCKKFTPENRETNCKIANLVFALCQVAGLVLPVWECPEFEEVKG